MNMETGGRLNDEEEKFDNIIYSNEYEAFTFE